MATKEKNATKADLLEATESYRDEIQHGLRAVEQMLGKTGKNALIITGALAGTYLIYRILSGSTKEPKSKKAIQSQVNQAPMVVEASTPSIFDRLTETVMEQAMMFALAIAKEKLVEYLQNQKNETVDGAS